MADGSRCEAGFRFLQKKMEITKEYIEKVLVDMHKTCTVDQYGQVATHYMGLNSLFGKDTADKVVKFVADTGGSLISINTYGGVAGIYKAITITSHALRKACGEALRQNPNYRYNMSRW